MRQHCGHPRCGNFAAGTGYCRHHAVLNLPAAYSRFVNSERHRYWLDRFSLDEIRVMGGGLMLFDVREVVIARLREEAAA